MQTVCELGCHFQNGQPYLNSHRVYAAVQMYFFSWRMYWKLSSEGDNTLLMALAEFNVFCVHEEKRKPTFLTYTVNH